LQSLTAGDEEPQWSSYIRGVLALYPQAVDFDAVLESTIPIGGGLSSSAALELGVLGLLRAIHAGETDKLTWVLPVSCSHSCFITDESVLFEVIANARCCVNARSTRSPESRAESWINSS
jgi:galactokinase